MAPVAMSVVLVLMTTVVIPGCLGCFPLDTVFQRSTQWSQGLRKPWRRIYAIGMEADDVMVVNTESSVHTRKARITCLEVFNEHRYLVKVEEEEKPAKFGCIRFTALNHQIVRKANTKLHRKKVKVNCDTSSYTEDAGVMIAFKDMSHVTCPLIGGYQMLIHEGVTVRAHCLDSVQTYNPRLEFSCDGNHVLADFGQDCAPTIPTQGKGQVQVPFAYLQCVGSWAEPGGEVNAILLQRKDDPQSFWCMHYKTSSEVGNDELLTIYLSFEGKCSGEVFNNNRDIPDSHSMFGTLAKYVPLTDRRCFEDAYIRKCRQTESTCYDTSECPLDCRRCNKKIPKKECGFKGAVGHWTTVDSRHGLALDVKGQGFKVAGHGIFSCHGKSGPEDGVYSMVRNSPYSSCLPLYVCAKVLSPSKGVLNFYLRLAERDGLTGDPKSCAMSQNGPRSLVPGPEKSTITLLDTQNMPEVACNIQRDMLFPTGLGECRFSLKKCTGSCTTLYGDYDAASCGNNTSVDIEHEHICHARYLLTDGIRAIITSSKLNQHFLCWIFTSQRLFITVPEHCNSDGASRIFRDENAHITYDPFRGLSAPQEAQVAGSNANTASTFSVHALLLVLHCVLFSLLARL